MPFAYPISLEVGGQRCLVVGGGPMAEAKARGLLEAGAAVVVVAERPTNGLDELARRGELELVRRPYRSGDLRGVLLVVVADDGERLRAAVFAEAQARRVLCNIVDDPSRCHFAAPALIRRGDLVVAVSTGGRAPALAGHVRDHLAGELPVELGALVDLVAEVRREGSGPADLPARGRAWRRALDFDVLGLLRDGRRAAARRLLRSVLTTAESPLEPARR